MLVSVLVLVLLVLVRKVTFHFHVSGTYTRLSVTTFYIDIPYITNQYPLLNIGKYSTLHYTLTIQPTTTESRDIRKAPALGFLPDIHMSSTLLGSFPRAHNMSIGGVDMVFTPIIASQKSIGFSFCVKYRSLQD